MFERLKKWNEERKRDPMFELMMLNVKLESDARDEWYAQDQETIQDCPRCYCKPHHSYDSHGIPFHKLKCPHCNHYAEYPRELRGCIETWNSLVKL